MSKHSILSPGRRAVVKQVLAAAFEELQLQNTICTARFISDKTKIPLNAIYDVLKGTTTLSTRKLLEKCRPLLKANNCWHDQLEAAFIEERKVFGRRKDEKNSGAVRKTRT